MKFHEKLDEEAEKESTRHIEYTLSGLSDGFVYSYAKDYMHLKESEIESKTLRIMIDQYKNIDLGKRILSEMKALGYCMKCDGCLDLKKMNIKCASQFKKSTDFKTLLNSIMKNDYIETCKTFKDDNYDAWIMY